MAELVDALASGASGRNAVRVRVSLSPQKYLAKSLKNNGSNPVPRFLFPPRGKRRGASNPLSGTI